MDKTFTNKTSIIGRGESDIIKYGDLGTTFLGKVVMSSGENPVLGRNIIMDIANPHLILITGKRGFGKSYTMATMLEEMAELPIDIRKRMSVIMIDTVGIFWSLKIPAKNNKTLEEWKIEPKGVNVRVLVPQGKINFYKEKQIPIEGAFTIKASELEEEEWLALFGISWKDPEGTVLSQAVNEAKEKLGTYYGIDELIKIINQNSDHNKETKLATIGRLKIAKSWGLIEKEGTKLKEIAKPGEITIIDVSSYRQAIGMEGTKDIIVALLGKKLFEQRMLYRKEEEIKILKGLKRESTMPLVWMMIDEAHMFMPKDGNNIALKVLLEWVRVGRQPGLGLILATQRPERLHPDAISQADMFISHRMTSQNDIQAVSVLRPSYLHQDFDKLYAEMPRGKGYAIVLDDKSEKIWMIKVKPRTSHDASTTATAFTY